MAIQLNQSQVLFGFALMKDTAMLLERVSKYKSFFDKESSKRETYEERGESLAISDHGVKRICQPRTVKFTTDILNNNSIQWNTHKSNTLQAMKKC